MKNKSYWIVKTDRPEFKNVFMRKRLLKLFDRVQGRSCIWITGPPGYGKTYLVSSYIETRKLPCLWYETVVNEESGFNNPKTVPSSSCISFPSEPSFMFIDHLAETCRNWQSDGGVIVIDDYQLQPTADPSIGELFQNFISHIPPEITLIVTSRMFPITNRLHHQNMSPLVLFNFQTLKLTAEETGEFIQFRTGFKFSQESISRLHTLIRGWTAGLELVRGMFEKKIFNEFSLSVDLPEPLYQYFCHTVTDHIESKIHKFLLKTAFLPFMTVNMAEKLTQSGESEHILQKLISSNYFIEKKHGYPLTYHYHPLFRKFLIKQAQETFSPGDLMLLKGAASVLLEKFPHPQIALAYFQVVTDHEELIPFILQQAPAIHSQGKINLLHQYLDRLPNDIIKKYPWLIYWSGVCHLLSEPHISKSYFIDAFTRFRFINDIAGQYISWSGIVDSIFYEFNSLEQLDRWLDFVGPYEQTIAGLTSECIQACISSRMAIALVLRKPEHPEIRAWAEKGLSLTRKISDNISRIQNFVYLSSHFMLMGDVEKSYFIINQLQQLIQGKEVSPEARIIIGFAESMFYQLEGDFQKCINVVSSCMELSQKSGFHGLDAMILGHCVSAALNISDVQAAEKFLNEMYLSLNYQKNWELSLFYFLKARLFLYRKEYRQALVDIDISLSCSAEFGSPFLVCLRHLLKSHILNQTKNHHESMDHLSHAREIAFRTGSNFLKFNVHIAESLFSFDQKKPEFDIKSLSKALDLGKKNKYLNTHIDIPSVTSKLCALAIENGIEIEYAKDLIQRRNLMPDKPPQHLENWPWHIKIYTFKRFEVIINGRPIQLSKQTQRKPLEMLKVLIAFGGRSIKEENISDALWPDSDGDVAHQAFATTLHRLRKLSGYFDMIELKNGLLTLNHKLCWIDAWSFERIIKQAEKAWENGSDNNQINKAVTLTKTALDLYHGPFLKDESSTACLLSYRDHLRSRYIRALIRLGDYLENTGYYDEALYCYQKGIYAEPFSEIIYRRKMICYRHLARADEALKIYDRCKRILTESFDILPSPEIETIRKSILSKN